MTTIHALGGPSRSGPRNSIDFKANGEASRMRSHKGNAPSLPQTKFCTLCPAKFTRTTHLNRHLRSHTNERSHKCDICTAEFTRSDLLTRHRRTCGDSRNSNRSRRKSCQACAESKVKCDLQLPCSKCIARGRDCTFVNDPDTTKTRRIQRRTRIMSDSLDGRESPESSPSESSAGSDFQVGSFSHSIDIDSTGLPVLPSSETQHRRRTSDSLRSPTATQTRILSPFGGELSFLSDIGTGDAGRTGSNLGSGFDSASAFGQPPARSGSSNIQAHSVRYGPELTSHSSYSGLSSLHHPSEPCSSSSHSNPGSVSLVPSSSSFGTLPPTPAQYDTLLNGLEFRFDDEENEGLAEYQFNGELFPLFPQASASASNERPRGSASAQGTYPMTGVSLPESPHDRTPKAAAHDAFFSSPSLNTPQPPLPVSTQSYQMSPFTLPPHQSPGRVSRPAISSPLSTSSILHAPHNLLHQGFSSLPQPPPSRNAFTSKANPNPSSPHSSISNGNVVDAARQKSRQKPYFSSCITDMKVMFDSPATDPCAGTTVNVNGLPSQDIYSQGGGDSVHGLSVEDRYLNLFFQMYTPQIPIIHVPSWKRVKDQGKEPSGFREESWMSHPILLKAMRACGALYVRGEGGKDAFEYIVDTVEELGDSLLAEFSNPNTTLQTRFTLITAVILLQSWNLLTRLPDRLGTSRLFHAIATTMIRRTNLIKLLSEWTMAIAVDQRPDQGALGDIWREWARYESMKRLLFFAYLLDTTTTAYFGASPLFHTSELAFVSLPCDDAIWEANDASTWWDLYHAQHNPDGQGAKGVRFGEALEMINEMAARSTSEFSSMPRPGLAHQINPFGWMILICTILRDAFTLPLSQASPTLALINPNNPLDRTPVSVDELNPFESAVFRQFVAADRERKFAPHHKALHTWLHLWSSSPAVLLLEEARTAGGTTPKYCWSTPVYWLAYYSLRVLSGAQGGTDELQPSVAGIRRTKLSLTVKTEDEAQERRRVVSGWMVEIEKRLKGGIRLPDSVGELMQAVEEGR